MGTPIMFLDEWRRKKAKELPEEVEFDTLFRKASALRMEAPDLLSEKIAVVNFKELSNWFRKEMADEVFRQRLFDRCILLSIGFVSDLLAAGARGSREHASPSGYLEAYALSGSPKDLLAAANEEFLIFSLWPERRTRRSAEYRTLALDRGPALYVSYAGITRHEFGYCMAQAFEPLGGIARDRFAVG